ncbi:hypothetical protein SS50377_27875 [Spironucleus salmonicida]|uniref:Nucleoplasmin-like domain-containing protein n=1 Tax=Spironucleus salmonicida TaxID=348837 RepID=V6LW68_9EUKA|nr:hypothetical protein SS50377_27875 [Spironucleus salmonicida]|eukprot:EST48810.1 Hypothetical protein SS50377_10905 [Spironucleus salmonicida]
MQQVLIKIDTNKPVYINEGLSLRLSHVSGEPGSHLSMQVSHTCEFSDPFCVARISQSGYQKLNLDVDGPYILNFITNKPVLLYGTFEDIKK